MKKFQKIVSLLLCIIILASAIPVSAMNAKEQNQNETLYESLLSTGDLQEISVKPFAPVQELEEISVDDYYCCKIDNDNLLKCLSISSDDVEEFTRLNDAYNNDIEYEAMFSNGIVADFDKNMNIVSYYNYKTSNTCGKNGLDSFIKSLRNEYNIDDSYMLSINNDNDDTVYYWEKVDENGLKNIYDSLTVRVDTTNNQVISINRFYDSAESNNIKISEESAKKIILDYCGNSQEITSCEQVYTKPNFYWNNDSVAYTKVDMVRLAYKITVDNLNIFYVDTETGEIIGGDTIMAANNSAVFGNSGLIYVGANMSNAKLAFNKLGYTSSVDNVGLNIRSDVLNYVNNDPKAYAFYINCHGNSSSLATKDSSGNSKLVLNSSEVSGNWHFVFLDACKTAANTTWANAFKINSNYSKRAFLGWSNLINQVNSHEFSGYFWNEVAARKYTSNVRDAAVWAADKVPGSGTTPIRFYGDRSYNGTAY